MRVIRRPVVILFDTDAGGHLPMHATELARAALQHEFQFEVVLCMPEAIIERLPPDIVQEFGEGGRIRFQPLSDREISASNCSNAVSRGINKWRLGQMLARRHHAKHVFYFVLDVIFAGALLEAATFRRPCCPFSGILFRPRIHLSDTNESLAEWTRRVRQWPYYATALNLPALTDVWSLDPFFVPYAQRRLPHGSKVQFIGESRILPDGQSKNSPAASGRVRFLMFGLLKKRKGVLVLLNALTTLAPSDWAFIEVVLLGEFEETIRDEAVALIAAIQSTPYGNLKTISRYVPTEVIAAEVQRADVILANYLDHVGSSGVVFAAALAGKPVITQRSGLLGELTRVYGLGSAIDTFDPLALADEMRRVSQPGAISFAFDPDRSSNYVALNHPGFAAQILSTIEARVRTTR